MLRLDYLIMVLLGFIAGILAYWLKDIADKYKQDNLLDKRYKV